MTTVAKGHPMWCPVYARKTPTIPVHNGIDRCIGCGADVAQLRRELKVYPWRERVANGRAS